MKRISTKFSQQQPTGVFLNTASSQYFVKTTRATFVLTVVVSVCLFSLTSTWTVRSSCPTVAGRPFLRRFTQRGDDCMRSAWSTTTEGDGGEEPCDVVKAERTYQRLAASAVAAWEAKRVERGGDGNVTLWIGVTGGPGAGKSTLAQAVASRIEAVSSLGAVALPLDGYHLPKAELTVRYPDCGLARRGAPWTFDPAALARDVRRAGRTGRCDFPAYDRVRSDPVPGAIALEPRHRIVLVEGNYLTLGTLLSSDSTADASLSHLRSDLDCPVPLEDELRRWVPVSDLWDLTWFVSPGLEEQRRRLVERSLETWTPAKTEAWGRGTNGTDREAAERRADFNDVKNARLVERCRAYADVEIDNS